MRKMLQQIGRCDQCLLHSKDHLANCRSLASPCRTCGSTAHYSITCDGGQHPGSWVTKMAKPNNNQSVTKTVTQTLNSNWHETTALVGTCDNFFGIQSSITIDNQELSTHALLSNTVPSQEQGDFHLSGLVLATLNPKSRDIQNSPYKVRTILDTGPVLISLVKQYYPT